MKLTATILQNGEGRRVLAYGSNLLPREKRREAVENGVVYVKDMGLLCELRSVPMIMGRENGGFRIRINANNEGFWNFIFSRNS